MDARNSQGQTISLLNGPSENTPAPLHLRSSPKQSHSHQSRPSLSYSYSHSPSASQSSHLRQSSYSRTYSYSSTTSCSSYAASSSGSYPSSRQHSGSCLRTLPILPGRTLSSVSTPSSSPDTPQLVRSDSSDSTEDMQESSPVTPEFPYLDPDHLVAQQHQHQTQYADPATAYFPQKAPYNVPIADMSPYTMPQFPQQPQQIYATPIPMPVEQPSQPAQKSKKNSYACPVAKQYNCSDYFTTSGHAARHAKKHTGKKDAICPDCNKAFTRKDNMEQHRRTHTTGRSSTRSSDDKVKKSAKVPLQKRPRPAPIQASAGIITDPMLQTDPVLPTLSGLSTISPTTTYPLTPGGTMLEPYPTYPNHYPDPAQFSMNPMGYAPRDTNDSYGLDTLAMAAASGDVEKSVYDDKATYDG